MITKQKIKFLIGYFKQFKNPISCLLFKFGLKKTVTIKPKKINREFQVEKIKILDGLLSVLDCKDEISPDFIKFIDDLNSSKKVIPWGEGNILNFSGIDLNLISFFELFNDGYWNNLDINYNGRCIIDIGSNGGDSSLYFATQGAIVYGFEPVKPIYEYSLKLIEVNPNLKNKLHFFNYGVSDKNGKINIDFMNSASAYSKNDSYEVEVITIEDILKENNIEPDLLKMDCEGCEYNIILNSDLSGFKDIIFEHHSSIVGENYSILIDKLKSQGFEIEKLDVFDTDFEIQGLIHAYK